MNLRRQRFWYFGAAIACVGNIAFLCFVMNTLAKKGMLLPVLLVMDLFLIGVLTWQVCYCVERTIILTREMKHERQQTETSAP